MEPVLWAVLLVVAAGAVLAAVPLTGGPRAEVSDTEMGELTERAGIPLPRRLRRPVVERLDSRGRGVAWWALAGVLGGFVLALLLSTTTGARSLVPPAVLGGAVLGSALGTLRALRRSLPPLTAGAPVVGSDHPLRVRDLTTGGEALAARLVPVVLVVAGAVALMVLARVPGPVPGGVVVPVGIVVSVAVGLTAWSVLRACARRIAGSPRRAGDDVALAWEDTLRAQALRDVLDVALVTGLLGLLAAALAAGVWLLHPAVRAAEGHGALLLGAVSGGTAVVGGLTLLVPWALGRMRGNPAAGLWAGREFADEG